VAMTERLRGGSLLILDQKAANDRSLCLFFPASSTGGGKIEDAQIRE
jgi:hypothetical protein